MIFNNKVQSLLEGWQAAASPVGDMLHGKGSLSWAEVRNAYVRQLESMLPPPAGVSFSSISLDGVETLVAAPDGIDSGRILFYIHGGGYVHGGVRAYQSLAGHYALRLRARVYLPEYRQAPEHPYPTPIDDTFRAYKALVSSGVPGGQIVISGDSAGGAMVVTVMRRARDAGIQLPAAGAAISPWADLTHSGPSAKSRDGLDPAVNVDTLHRLARTFLADGLTTNPEASPIFAEVQGLPPVMIQMGENEVMLSGGISLAERLAEQRVRVTLEVWPRMFHVWHMFAGHMAEADEALDNAVSFLSRELDRVTLPKSSWLNHSRP